MFVYSSTNKIKITPPHSLTGPMPILVRDVKDKIRKPNSKELTLKGQVHHHPSVYPAIAGRQRM